MVKDNKNLIVGLDIGTSKIVAIVAELTPEKRLNIIGLGAQPSNVLRLPTRGRPPRPGRRLRLDPGRPEPRWP